MQAARNQLGAVPRLDLESNLCALNMDDPGGASDCPSEGCGGQMAQLDLNTHAAFIRLQKRLQRLPRRPFQQANEIGSAQDSRHPVRGKINHMLLLHDKLQFARGTDFRMRVQIELSQFSMLNE